MEPQLSEQQLTEYETLARAATPGPWDLWRPGQPAEVVDPEGASLGRIWLATDAAFVAASRTAVEDLVAEVRALRNLLRT